MTIKNVILISVIRIIRCEVRWGPVNTSDEFSCDGLRVTVQEFRRRGLSINLKNRALIIISIIIITNFIMIIIVILKLLLYKIVSLF